jgi:hypothetical protein
MDHDVDGSGMGFEQFAGNLNQAKRGRARQINLCTTGYQMMNHRGVTFFVCPTSRRRAEFIVNGVQVGSAINQQINHFALIIDRSKMKRCRAVIFGVDKLRRIF